MSDEVRADGRKRVDALALSSSNNPLPEGETTPSPACRKESGRQVRPRPPNKAMEPPAQHAATRPPRGRPDSYAAVTHGAVSGILSGPPGASYVPTVSSPTGDHAREPVQQVREEALAVRLQHRQVCPAASRYSEL